MLQHLLATLPEPLRWAPHNLLAHPASELLHLTGWLLAGRETRLTAWGHRLHDLTIPTHTPGAGRG